jgi:CBS domain-containing protein
MKTIQNIIKRKGKSIWSTNPNMKVFEALQIMAEKDVGALPVLDGKKLVGIFSERDYARKVILQGKASKNIPVSEIMSTHLITVQPSLTNEQGLAIMTEKHIRHLPVLHAGNMIGFISIGDLVKSIIEEQKEVIGKLEQHIMETTGLN